MPLIPVNNPAALVGYYLGVASLIPVLGVLTGLPAVICGGIGIAKARSAPQSGGMGHAITAIVLGIGGPVLWVVVVIAMGLFS